MSELKPFDGTLDEPTESTGLKPFDGTLDGEKTGAMRKLGDLGLSVAKGVVAVPETAVGLADLVSGGRAGKFVENSGVRFKDAKDMLSSYQSADYKGKQQQFNQADGFLEKTGVALQNPSLISNAVAESVPLIGAGGVGARALMAAAPKVGAVMAGAAGEGIVGAGSAAEGIRQETPDGLLTGEQAALAGASGGATALFGAVGGKVANRLGIADAETALAGGTLQAGASGAQKGMLRRAAEGAVSEGVLEELPQSMSEQALQNVALGKEWTKDLDAAAAMGLLSGGAMGGGMGAVTRNAPAAEPPAMEAPAPVVATPAVPAITPSAQMGITPEAGPLSRVAADAVDNGVHADIQQAQAVDEDQAAYDAHMAQQEAEAQQQDTANQPITQGPLAEAQMSDEDKRAVLFSNQAVADGGMRYEGTQDGDILNGMGAPFATRMAAARRAKMEGAGWTIAPVFDGFVARRKDAFKEPNGTTDGIQPVSTASGGNDGPVTQASMGLGATDGNGLGADARGYEPSGVGRAGEHAGGVPTAPLAPTTDKNGFIVKDANNRVKIESHEKGSNALDPNSDTGALLYTVRGGMPLDMVLSKDGKLVVKGSAMNSDGTSNGVAWVPPNVAISDKIKSLLSLRALTDIGSKERSDIDAEIKSIVQSSRTDPNVKNPAPAAGRAQAQATPDQAPQAVAGDAATTNAVPGAGSVAVEGGGVNIGEKTIREQASVATATYDTEKKLRFAAFAESLAGQSKDAIQKAIVNSEFGAALAVNELDGVSKSIAESASLVADQARKNAAQKAESTPAQKLENQIKLQKLRVEQASDAMRSATDTDRFGLPVENGPKKQSAIKRHADAQQKLSELERELSEIGKQDASAANRAKLKAKNTPTVKDSSTVQPVSQPTSTEVTAPTANKAPSLTRPNIVVRDVRGFGGEKLGDIIESHDGTKEGILAAADRTNKRLQDEYPDASHAGSRTGATDENGAPKWAISPNGQNIAPFDTKEGAYIFGDLSAAPTPQPTESTNEKAPEAVETKTKPEAGATTGVQQPAAGSGVGGTSEGVDNKAKWIKAVADKNRLNGSTGVQLTVTSNGKLSFLGDPNSSKDGRALQANLNEALKAGATVAEIAEALKQKPAPKPAAKPSRQYHLVAVNEKTGEKTTLTRTPVSHSEAVTMKGKYDDKPGRRIQLEDVTPTESASNPLETKPAERTATEHAGVKIYPITFKGESRWAVQSENNRSTGLNKSDNVLGDTIHSTLDEAKQEAERQVARVKSQQERSAAHEAEAAAAQAKKDANKGKSIVERKRDADLDKPTRLHPNAGLGTGTRRESMQKAVDQDRYIEAATVRDEAAKKRDTDLVERSHRANLPTGNINYPGVKEYFEAQARLKANKYEKPEYRVYMGRDGSDSFYEITKTEYDYAQGLKSAPKDPRENYIKVAANSIGQLRKSDVDRVLSGLAKDNIDGVTRADLAAYIKEKHPDYAQEVDDVLAELSGANLEPHQMTEAQYGEQERQKALADMRSDLQKAKSGEMLPYARGAKSKAELIRSIESDIAKTEQSNPERFAGDHLGHINKALRDGKTVPEANLKRYDVQPVAATPIHQDPGQAPEAATAPVIAQSLAKAARKEDHTQKEMRLWLVGEIDKAVKLTEDYADYQESIKKNGQDIADSIFFGKHSSSVGLTTPQGNGTITFDVPGDGKFKIRNSLRGLMEFRAKVEAKSGTGFTDKPTKAKGLPASTGVAKGSSNQIEALSSMLEELDFEAAVDYARETGTSLDAVKISPEVRKQFETYLKDGTEPQQFSPSRYWEYPGQDGADKDGNPIRKATLTKQIGASEYVALVVGTNATGFKYNITKDGKAVHAMLTSNSFANALKLAEDAINAIQPEVVKPKDTGWNMAGVGFAGKRYRGRNIILDDGREVVARIYENAGQYEDAEVKVDGVSKFRKTDRYKAEKLADDFIRTLTAKDPAKAPIKVIEVTGQTQAPGQGVSTAEQVETAKELLVDAKHGDHISDDDRKAAEQALGIYSLNGMDDTTLMRVLYILDVNKATREKVSRMGNDKPRSINDLADVLGAMSNAAQDKAANEKIFNRAEEVSAWDDKVKELFNAYTGAKLLLDGIAMERGSYGVKWAEKNVGSRWTSQSFKVRDIKARLIAAIKGAKDTTVEASDEPLPAISEAQARKQFEWRNMGQKDGTKSHLLFFFESEKDKGTGAAMNRGEVSLYPGASGWKVEDGDGTSYKSLADAKKAAIDLAIPKLQDQGYILKPAQAATAILDAANVTGKERIDALKDVKKGDITPEELQAAYPAKDSATFPNTAQGAIDAFNADDSTQAVAIMAKLKLDDLKEVGGAVGFRPQIGENAKAFRERIGTVADKLTKTSREQTSREMTLHKRLTQLASDYDRAIAHRDRAIANGAEAGSSAFEGQYEGQWTTIDKGLAILENALQEESKSPDYAKVSAMVKEARPAIFDAAKPDDSVKPEAVTPVEQANAIEPLATEAVEDTPDADIDNDQIEKIGDFGRKVMVRKDEAQPTGRKMAKSTDERPAWSRPYVVMQATEGRNAGKWRVMKLLKGEKSGAVMTTGSAVFDTEQEALNMIPMVEVARNHRAYPLKMDASTGYGIYRLLAEGKKRALVKGGFASSDEAMAYMAKNPIEIIEHKFKFPERPWLDKIERTGVPRRTKNVTKAMFEQTFAPGGVVYGNWLLNDDKVTVNSDGQELSNLAFDALMDLAETLGVPPKALFLNGEMVLALGADGKGGINSGAAHYSPDKGLINLTKINGAGSLAHEWWHSVDHYFAKSSGWKDSNSVVSYGFNSARTVARPELMAAIKRVIETINYTNKSTTTDAAMVRANAQSRIEKSVKSLNYKLDQLRMYLVKPWKAGKKPATVEQLAEFDALADKLREGDAGEQVYIPPSAQALLRDKRALGFAIGSNIRDMNAIYKSVVGSSFLKSDPQSEGRQLVWPVEAIKDNKEKIETKDDLTVEHKGRTDFYIEARDIDSYRASSYWSTPHEMGARAFESYIFDKLTAGKQQSDYLVYAVENRYYAGLDMKPYPEGSERQAINKAFDNLFSVVQTKETDGGNVAMFSRPRFSRGAQSQANESVERLATGIASHWDNAPKIVVAFDMNDPAIHEDVRKEDQRQRSGGATGTPEGFYYKGTVYLMSSKLGTPNDIARVLFHESLGHYGLRGTFGKALRPILRDVAMMRRAEVDAKIHQYGLKMGSQLDRFTAAEEVLAEMAQTKPEIGFVQRAIAAIRTWLRQNVPGFNNMRLTDDELIRNYILPARAWVERGGDGGPKGGFPVMSRGTSTDQTDTAAFRNWFGDSKVVDSQGKPLVVMHASPEERSTFDIGESRARYTVSPDAMGAWFTADQRLIDRIHEIRSEESDHDNYDPETDSTKPYSGVTQQVFLSIKNPKVAKTRAEMDSWVEPGSNTEELKRQLVAKGFDGVRVLDDYGHGESWVAFSPEQIKSATGNSGAFDGQNPDIRFSRSIGDTLTSATNSVRDVALPAGYKVNDLIASVPGKLNWWHKTVGTQYNLAQRSPAFKRVFDSVQNFINDVSYFATEAADLAPTILPKLESWKDIARAAMKPEDAKALSRPVFEGTLLWGRDSAGKPVKMEVLEAEAAKVSTDEKAQILIRKNLVSNQVMTMWRGMQLDQYNALIEGKYEREMLRPGVVWKDAELKSMFGLNETQIPLYKEFRKATDKSLTNLAITDMLRYAGKDAAPIRDVVQESKTAMEAAETLRDYLLSLTDDGDSTRSNVLTDTANTIIDKATRALDLIDRGYAPLSRFGQHTVDVLDAEGERVYFGMFESTMDAAKMARDMIALHPGATVKRGTVSQEEYKLFAGVSPETLELFGDMLGLEAKGDDAASKAFQTYIKLSKNNRSSMKRLLTRKGIAGFSEDAGRVLAGFVYSNARQSSKNLHMGEMTEAASVVGQNPDGSKNGEGELKDAAVQLVDYIQNPMEEAQAIRGLMFAQYIGGSVASAMVNLTQPITMTFPWLSQYGGGVNAAKQMTAAMRDALKARTGDTKLDAAIRRAEEDGTVSPQEVHQLMQQSQGKGALRSGDGTRAGNALATAQNGVARVGLAWGKLFGAAEQFNRRVTFIAAYRTAVAEGMKDPDGFARKAISETQGIYNKGNKPRWARGAVGATLFTFKQFSVAYIEMLSRMAKNGPEGKKAALLALGVLFLMSGAGGFPGADDMDDIISGALQALGYNFDSKAKRKAVFAELFGEGGAQFMERGVSGLPGVPIDLSGRMGLGNLIPGTGLFTKKTDHTRDVTELLGPVGDLAKRGFEAAGQMVRGDVQAAVNTVSPVAVRNLTKAYDMASMGMYRDQSGKKVIDTDTGDAIAKAIGFQPSDVKRVQDASQEAVRMIGLNKMRESDIADEWAKGLFERDISKVQAARADISAWNRDNPESPISIKFSQVLSRVKQMNMTKEQRIAKTAPAEIRATVRKELAAR